MSDELLVHTDDAGLTTTLTLNRPRSRNAIDSNILTLLSQAIDAAEASSVRTLVIKGSEHTFCSGSDLKALRSYDRTAQGIYAKKFQDVLTRLEYAELLTVAQVEGYCMGGGVELAMACDIRVATRESVWSFPEVNIGAIPSAGGTQRLPRYVGIGQAKRMLLSGERFGAEQMATIGLVDVLVDDEAAANAWVLEQAQRSSTAPRIAFSQIKRLTLTSLDVSIEAGLFLERLSDDSGGRDIEPA